MSGPKMVGITCDQEVIARNNERLKQIGKERYFKDLFADINIDIANTAKWVENYGNKTLNKLPAEYGDRLGILQEIKSLKDKYINQVNDEKINYGIISTNNAEQLNDIGVQKVEDIPKWKEKFLEEISGVLKKLQSDVKQFYAYAQQIKKENKRIQEISKEWMSKVAGKKEILENVTTNKVNVQRYLGDEIPFMPRQEEHSNPETLPFAIEELALLEMLENDLNEYSQLDYLTVREKSIINELRQELQCVIDNGESAYSMASKRAVLQQMKMEYVRLQKYVSAQLAAKNAQMEERNMLELEYVSFSEALDLERENYSEFSMPELKEKVNVLRSKVGRQESRIYIEESIEDIMKDYGYTSISSYQLHDADSVSRIIFEDSEGGKISTSFGDGMIMMNVIGEGDNPPTDREVEEMLSQQEAFCELYPHIRKKLLKKGIHINYENLMPVSADQTSNEKIVRQKNIRKSTKRFSFRHVQLVSENQSEQLFDDDRVQHYQYVKGEE